MQELRWERRRVRCKWADAPAGGCRASLEMLGEVHHDATPSPGCTDSHDRANPPASAGRLTRTLVPTTGGSTCWPQPHRRSSAPGARSKALQPFAGMDLTAGPTRHCAAVPSWSMPRNWVQCQHGVWASCHGWKCGCIRPQYANAGSQSELVRQARQSPSGRCRCRPGERQ